MKKIGLFFSMLACVFATTTYAQNNDGNYVSQDGYNQTVDSQYDTNYDYGRYDGRGGNTYASGYGDQACAQPCEKPMNDCYCLYCKYEPCYYNKTHCEYVPKYTCKKNCRMVPQYYQKQCCRYVPQYYNVTCCRQVPEYYYTTQCHYEPKYTCERCCKYVPKYYYKHTCAPTCTSGSCAEVR